MSAQMAELLQVHFSPVKLVLFDFYFFYFFFILEDHKFVGGKWARGSAHVCSFCERDPGERSKKPAPDFLKVFPLPSAAVILTRGTFFPQLFSSGKRENSVAAVDCDAPAEYSRGCFRRLRFLKSQTAVFSPTMCHWKAARDSASKVTCLDLPSMPGARTHCAARR